MMSVSFHENFDYSETNISYDDVSCVVRTGSSYSPKDEEIHLFAEKLRVPTLKNHTSRPRLTALLTKFSEQIGATLVTGRAGTGKTTLAADFAQNYERVAWYSVASADADWKVFSSCFVESFKNANLADGETTSATTAEEASPFVENLFARISKDKNAGQTEDPALIVLDDVHYIFDAEWFADFFNSLLYSLGRETHLLLLSRSSPAFPLWRLRSKQVLGVIDEELLLFNREEAGKFLAGYNLSGRAADEIFTKSFGRIAKLKLLAEKATEKRARWSD
jgi:LuxR family transcriptional regulator, maltose regulon positive regulatory protein